MTNTAVAPLGSEPIPSPSLIAIYGLDQGGKTHASTFKGSEAELAEKAAGLMGLRVLSLASAEHGELAQRLPAGRVFASGKAFVPFVKKALYDKLCALGGVPTLAPQPARPKAKHAGAAEGATATTAEQAPSLPTGWDTIGADSLVLATTGPQEGWFESVVVRAKGDDLFVLRWQDWPDEPQFSRRRHQLALLPSAAAPQTDAAA